eukprot:m51a1_g4003 putative dmX-like protein (2514) ;mRNA; f:526184-534711
MIPSQILPGVQRGAQLSWSWGTLDGKSYIAYGCGNAVVVASGALKVLQHLPLDARLAACSGKRVAVFAPRISSRAGEDEDARWEHLIDIYEGFCVSAVQWLEAQGPPSTASLVVAGSHLSVHTLNVPPRPETPKPGAQQSTALEEKPSSVTRWRRELGRPITAVSCSPDGKFIATVGGTDELVKVWYNAPPSLQLPVPEQASTDQQQQPQQQQPQPQQKGAILQPKPLRQHSRSVTSRPRSPPPLNLTSRAELKSSSVAGAQASPPPSDSPFGEEMSFLYLRHPASVQHLSWRRHKRSAADASVGVDENVLMTVAADGVVRLWSLQQQADSTPAPVPQYRRPRFHLCGTIATGPGSLVEWVSALLMPPKPPGTGQGILAQSRSPQLPRDDGDKTFHTHTECPMLGMHTAAARKLSPGDVDYLIEVTRSGGVVIWRFRTIPYQMPTITVWARVNITSSPTRSIMPVCFAYTTPLPTQKSSPTAFWLYVNNAGGTIACWTITRSSMALPIKMQADLTSQMFGHRSPITSVVAHPTNPFVASIDSDKTIVIWHCEDNKPYEHPSLLQDICTLSHYTLISWVPNAMVFMVSSGVNAIYTYALDETLIGPRTGNNSAPPGQPAVFPHFLLGMLEESDNLNDISFLQAIPREAFPPEFFAAPPGEEPLPPDWCTVAIAEDGQYAVFWACNVIGDRFVSQCIMMHDFLGAEKKEGDRVRAAAVVSFQSCMRMSADALPAYLHTGHADGTVRQWIISIGKDGEPTLTETFRVSAHTGPVSAINVAYFGRFASWSSSEPDIKIWQLESSGGSAFELESAIDVGNESQRGGWGAHFDWTPLYDGVDTLALASGCLVRVMSQTDDVEAIGTAATWRDVARHGLPGSGTPTSPPCSALAWTYYGTLVAAFGQQLKVFSRFGCAGAVVQQPALVAARPGSLSTSPVPSLTPTPPFLKSATPSLATPARLAMGPRAPIVKPNEDAVDLTKTEEQEKKEEEQATAITTAETLAQMMAKEKETSEAMGIFAKAIAMHRSMPLYHPYVLEHWMRQGQFDRVERTLRALLPYAEALADPARCRTATFTLGVDEILEDRAVEVSSPKVAKDQTADILEGESDSLAFMDSDDGKQLLKHLSAVRLPGVDAMQQSRMRALAEASKKAQQVASSLDPAGARFVASYFLFSELRRLLPEGHPQRPTSMRTSDFAWALLSDSQDRILATCLPTDCVWEDARAIGVGYWLQNPTALRNITDRMSKSAFAKHKDPADCALFYLALGKKSALLALYKLIKDPKITKFLSNDFNDPKWKAAAAKNAYILEGQHRPFFAAAFFLLGGSLKDCLHVCESKLDDLQLALFISRIYEAGTVSSAGTTVMGPAAQAMLQDNIVKEAQTKGDICLEFIAHWRLREYEKALRCVGAARSFDAAALQLFEHIRRHVLLREAPADARSDVALLRRALYAYHSAGCEVLALQIVRRLQESLEEDRAEQENSDSQEAQRREAQREAQRQQAMEKSKPKPKEEAPQAPAPAPQKSTGDEWDDLLGGSTAKPRDDDWDFGEPSATSSSQAPKPQEEDEFVFKRKDDWMDDLGGAEPAKPPPSAQVLETPQDDYYGGHAKEAADEAAQKPPEDLDAEHQKQREEEKLAAEHRQAERTQQRKIETALHQTLIFGAALRSTIREVAENDAESQAADQALRTWSDCTRVDKSDLVRAVLEFCYVYGYYAQESTLARAAQDPENALKAVAQAVQDCAMHARTFPELLVAHTPSLTFCRTLESLSRQLYQCLQTTRQQTSAVSRRRIEFTTYFGLFLSWWRQKKWHLLRELLNYDVENSLAYTVRLPADTMPPSVSAEDLDAAWPSSKKKVELPETYDAEAVARFSERLLSLLSVYAAVTRLTAYFSKPLQSGPTVVGWTSASPRPQTSSGLSPQSAAAAAAAAAEDDSCVVRALERWAAVLEQRLSLSVPGPDVIGAAPGMHAKTLMALVKRSEAVRANAALWNCIKLNFKVVYSSVKRRIVCRPGDVARLAQRHLMVGESRTKYTDTSPLTAFCLSTDGKYAAVASTKGGVKEVDIVTRSYELDNDSDSDFEDSAVVAAQQQEQAQAMHLARRSSSQLLSSTGGQAPSPPVGVQRPVSPHGHITPSPMLALPSRPTGQLGDGVTPVPTITYSSTSSPVGSEDDYTLQQQQQQQPREGLGGMLRPTTFPRAVSPGFYDAGAATVMATGYSPREPTPPPKLSSMLKKPAASSSKPIITMSAPVTEGSTPCMRPFAVNFLDSHPFFPYYLSSGQDGKVRLWQFLSAKELAAFQILPQAQNAPVNRARFSPTGMRFGAVDKSGYFALWSFSAGDSGVPFYKVMAHAREATDLAFLNSGSFIATAGSTNDPKRCVALWDTLLPSHSACVAQSTTIQERVNCIAYSPRYQLLLAGDKTGTIHSFDIRKFVPMKTIKAHSAPLKSLAYEQDQLFSACSDGVVKIWSLPSLKQEHVWDSPHGSGRGKIASGSAVTHLQVGEHEGRMALFTSGADCRLAAHNIQFTV